MNQDEFKKHWELSNGGLIGGQNLFVNHPKPFKYGFMLGRFQHIHKGHEHVILKALSLCNNLIILVGSSQESGTVRNPFYVTDRIKLIKNVFGDLVHVGYIDDMTNEDDHCIEWGDYVLKHVDMWSTIYNIQEKPDVMIYGNDEERQSWFSPDAVADITQVVIPRSKVKISATQMREHMILGEVDKWKEFTNPKLHSQFNSLRKKLLSIPEYVKMVEGILETRKKRRRTKCLN